MIKLDRKPNAFSQVDGAVSPVLRNYDGVSRSLCAYQPQSLNFQRMPLIVGCLSSQTAKEKNNKIPFLVETGATIWHHVPRCSLQTDGNDVVNL